MGYQNNTTNEECCIRNDGFLRIESKDAVLFAHVIDSECENYEFCI